VAYRALDEDALARERMQAEGREAFLERARLVELTTRARRRLRRQPHFSVKTDGAGWAAFGLLVGALFSPAALVMPLAGSALVLASAGAVSRLRHGPASIRWAEGLRFPVSGYVSARNGGPVHATLLLAAELGDDVIRAVRTLASALPEVTGVDARGRELTFRWPPFAPVTPRSRR
jgi:hypothetical protein